LLLHRHHPGAAGFLEVAGFRADAQV